MPQEERVTAAPHQTVRIDGGRALFWNWPGAKRGDKRTAICVPPFGADVEAGLTGGDCSLSEIRLDGLRNRFDVVVEKIRIVFGANRLPHRALLHPPIAL